MHPTPIAYYTSNDGTGLLAFGDGPVLQCETGDALPKLDVFLAENQGRYLFSFLGYDLKNEIEELTSANFSGTNLPDLFCWNPAYVVQISDVSAQFLQGVEDAFSRQFLSEFQSKISQTDNVLPVLTFQPRMPKAEYLRQIDMIHAEIQQGNTYELNFCQEFYAENVPEFNSWSLVNRLNALTAAPFAGFISFGPHEIFCGSPERYLQKTGEKLISQPIKGTIRRGAGPEEDVLLKNVLQNDPKERAENIMIADLVRNDLSRIAQKGSVSVDELCGIHSFSTVHHMISTISCLVKPETRFSDILRATFPMGSMTGAPKISTMQLIEKHESFKRGLYAGSMGYFKPDGDFDFNVVIRSFIHNKAEKYLSCAVGGAITIQAVAEKEYDECMVKVKRIVQLFGDDQPF